MNRALKILLAALTLGAVARADTITLSPNVIHGTIGFSNTNPAVTDILTTLNFSVYNLSIGSTDPTGYSGDSDSPYVGQGGPIDSTPYSISAEGDGGHGSVTYNVSLNAYYQGQSSLFYYEPQTVTLFPSTVETAGATLNFSALATVHHVHFASDSACTMPVAVVGAQIQVSDGEYYNSLNDITSFDYIAPNWPDHGANQPATTATLYIYTGSNAFVDETKYAQPIDVGPYGDQVIDHCIVIPSGNGSAELGSITTPVSLKGHTAISSVDGQGNWGYAYGPDTNSRLSEFTAGTDVSFINLVPGDWTIRMDLRTDPGPNESEFFTAYSYDGIANPISVVGGADTDGTQSLNGVPEQPFVMNPAYFNGDLLFHDQYVQLHPGAASSLSSLWFTQDLSANGASIYGADEGSNVFAQGAQNASAATTYPGRYNPSTGDLATTYSLPVAMTYDQPESWSSIPYVSLVFNSVANPYYKGDLLEDEEWGVPSDLPADLDPSTFRHGYLQMTPPPSDPGAVLSPGQAVPFSAHYCFNEVVVGLQSTTGSFVNPTIDVNGAYSGVDFEGNQVSYQGSGVFVGMPNVGIYVSDPDVFLNSRTTTGSVSFALPQGTWTLTPLADFVDDNGASGASNFSEVTTLSLGCGQHVALVPGLSVLLDQPATCTQPTGSLDLVPLSGTINSGGAGVDRVWYTVNNGPEIDICNIANNITCGETFNVEASLGQGDNSISVFASSGFVTGIPESDESISCDANGCGTSCTTPPPTCTPVSYAPVDSDYGTVMFEDLWPTNGDLDFNDQNLAYNYEFLLDSNNNVIGLQATFNMLSIGATIANGLYLHLPVSVGAAGEAFLTTGSGNEVQIAPLSSLGDATSLNEVVYQLADDTRTLFGGASGYINTELNQPTLSSTPLTLSIRFGAALPQSTFASDEAPFDIFIARTATKNHQVHLPAYSGAATGASHALFNTSDDGSNTNETASLGANNTGRWFVNKDGLPFGLVIPQLIVWPKETTPIQSLFPEISDFATSAGASDPGFYTDQVIAAASWQQSIENATQLLAPASLDQTAFPGVTACSSSSR